MAQSIWLNIAEGKPSQSLKDKNRFNREGQDPIAYEHEHEYRDAEYE